MRLPLSSEAVYGVAYLANAYRNMYVQIRSNQLKPASQPAWKYFKLAKSASLYLSRSACRGRGLDFGLRWEEIMAFPNAPIVFPRCNQLLDENSILSNR